MEDDKVKIIDYPKFSDECDEANAEIVRVETAALENSNIPNKKKSMKQLSEKAKLWIKHDKTLVLHGLIDYPR